MARLIYTGITSLDGYIADENGNFDWGMPDEEVHAFVNDLERPSGTYLYGRRLYDVMVYWETLDTADEPTVVKDYAQLWRAADKIVYSSTLQAVASDRTRIERTFDPDAVRALKDASSRDLSIGGPHLAVHALRAGLVDEIRTFVSPVTVGGGIRFVPDHVGLELELLDELRFRNGVVYLAYRTRG
ncbi:MAG: deaminase [Microbacteriaceae bacterium]|nr:MAG: deaminase [Microbacteriaceae bacterium]